MVLNDLIITWQKFFLKIMNVIYCQMRL